MAEPASLARWRGSFRKAEHHVGQRAAELQDAARRELLRPDSEVMLVPKAGLQGGASVGPRGAVTAVRGNGITREDRSALAATALASAVTPPQPAAAEDEEGVEEGEEERSMGKPRVSWSSKEAVVYSARTPAAELFQRASVSSRSIDDEDLVFRELDLDGIDIDEETAGGSTPQDVSSGASEDESKKRMSLEGKHPVFYLRRASPSPSDYSDRSIRLSFNVSSNFDDIEGAEEDWEFDGEIFENLDDSEFFRIRRSPVFGEDKVNPFREDETRLPPDILQRRKAQERLRYRLLCAFQKIREQARSTSVRGSDNEPLISADDLGPLAELVGCSLDQGQLSDIISHVDFDNDGKLSFDEVVKGLQHEIPEDEGQRDELLRQHIHDVIAEAQSSLEKEEEVIDQLLGRTGNPFRTALKFLGNLFPEHSSSSSSYNWSPQQAPEGRAAASTTATDER